jgi:hypothetical protein
LDRTIPVRKRRWILIGTGVGLALVWLAAHALAYQGMATPSGVRSSTLRIRTGLPPIHPDFRDVAAAADLDMVHVSGGTESKKYIIETTGSGVAIFDFDNDGLMDVFLVNGATLNQASPSTSHLYRNLGSLKFEDVTAKAGLRIPAGARASAPATTITMGTATCLSPTTDIAASTIVGGMANLKT